MVTGTPLLFVKVLSRASWEDWWKLGWEKRRCGRLELPARGFVDLTTGKSFFRLC